MQINKCSLIAKGNSERENILQAKYFILCGRGLCSTLSSTFSCRTKLNSINSRINYRLPGLKFN